MDRQKAVLVSSTWAGVTYTYNGVLPYGERRKIDDNLRERVIDIKNRFALVDIKADVVTKDWLNAQPPFWMLLNREYSPWPKLLEKVFAELRSRWFEAHPEYTLKKMPARATRKRPLEQEKPQVNDPSHNKKFHAVKTDRGNGEGPSTMLQKVNNSRVVLGASSRSSVNELQNRTGNEGKDVNNTQAPERSRTKQSMSALGHPSGAKRVAGPIVEVAINKGKSPAIAEASRIESEVFVKPEPSERSVPHLTPKWLSLLEEAKEFERTNYMYSIAGNYIIRCPQLEKMFPGLEGQLSLNIKHLRDNSIHNGVFQAHLDLGVFVGTAAMGLNNLRLSRYLWHTAKKGPHGATETHNAETRRLRHEAHLPGIGVGAYDMTQNEAKIGKHRSHPINVDTCKAPLLIFQFRVEDQYDQFVGPGKVFSDRGRIDFADVRCLRLDGSIMLPIISDDLVSFEGFKISQQPRLCKAWKEWLSFPTSAVRFGNAWIL